MSIFTDDHETKVTLEAGGNALPDDMPFRLLLLGDWSGRSSRADSNESGFRTSRPVEIDRDNFEEVHAFNALGRGVDVDDIVRALRFIVATPVLTGQTIVLDGGQRFLSLPRDVQYLEKD